MNEPNVIIEMNGLDFNQDVEPLIKEFFPLLYREEGAIILRFSLSDEEMRVEIRETAESVPVVSGTETFSSFETAPKKRHRDYRNQL